MSGLGIATVCNIVIEVSQAIVECLWTEHVTEHFPKSEKMFIDKMVYTEEFWQFSCCWAAVDGCHISIKCPPGGLESCKEYHNFKNFYSLVLMASVDAKTVSFGLAVAFRRTPMIPSYCSQSICESK